LAKHLRRERPYLFTFLYCPGLVDATNNLAERVMRLLVVIRKNWGGNRTQKGARAQAVLTSILCTARQQDKDVFTLLTNLLRSAQPKLLDLVGPVPAGSESDSGVGKRAAEASQPKRDRETEARLAEFAPATFLPEWAPSAGLESFFSSA
jgi:hypothetical protein